MNIFFKRTARVLHNAERGNMDGDYAFIVYSPFMIAVLMVGICFAMIGFWRLGASYSAQRSAQLGAVSPGKANGALTAYFVDWTNASSVAGASFGVDAPNRTVTAALRTHQTFEYQSFGPWNFGIEGQTLSRSERFYPGKPLCNADGCDE